MQDDLLGLTSGTTASTFTTPDDTLHHLAAAMQRSREQAAVLEEHMGGASMGLLTGWWDDRPVPDEPGEDDVPVHRYDTRRDIAYFSLGTNFGNGRPHYFVTLDEDGGERSWWLDPEQAEVLGRRLVELGGDCMRRNDEEARRRAAWRTSHPKDP